MEYFVVTSFLFLLVLGSYIQTVTGFALGLFVMGAATLFDLAAVAMSAAIVTISSLVNTSMALRQEHHHVNWSQAMWLSAGLLPAMGLGLWLLEYFSGGEMALLRMLLGLFIVIGAVLLALKPHPRKQSAGAPATFLVGMVAGVFGGLFSTAGPPVVYHLYREPIAVNTIRMTMIAVFAIATAVRLLVVIPAGHVTEQVLWISALGAPLVILATWFGQRYRPPVSDLGMRRLAFILLMLLGLILIIPA